MPGLNQTGPMGQGAMTGRHMGRCTNNGVSAENVNSTNNQDLNQNNPVGVSGRRKGLGQGQGGIGMGMGRKHRFRNGQ